MRLREKYLFINRYIGLAELIQHFTVLQFTIYIYIFSIR